MNVASLELSKALFELSGWEDTAFVHDVYGSVTDSERTDVTSQSAVCPAYDLGYLLRKLPFTTLMQISDGGQFHCWHFQTSFTEDTPEDAACKLAIELFKQGVLKRGAGHE